jgi:galactose-1-phosphate uridylyltransferase
VLSVSARIRGSARNHDVTSRDYVVKSERAVVEAWARKGLQFEPQGWMRAFRNDLRKAVGDLSVPGGQVLDADHRRPSENEEQAAALIARVIVALVCGE